ncbi:UDP-2,3-diacylglucosamine diphosphatase [Candidatus Palibaumannia cicadellinicola]|uniref:UDP-2,3-diacylglucosamine hydrolase n=1 Tax=Candidatus Palibaumannia cicadellinicola TaxID=186490 RepID=A0A088MXD1_9GAMM|nr:UDP-2,3-diacylglucosamine diphosphatase [Candidatus Baumannia cicadellinicola]AIN47025.1 UDP-2,3-diacylglucosamine hydrolase [Candidatus Baumannia cicadellinicola]
MSTLFVADIHLCDKTDTITAGFLHLLRNYVPGTQALYILGDLFDIWIGDDEASQLHIIIAAALKILTEGGVPCYFIHGNRDFLLGHNYAAACGMTLLPTKQVLEVSGWRVVILHGNILCTDDAIYQIYRHQVHQRWLQKLFLRLPLSVRRRLANHICANSMNMLMNNKLQEVVTVLAHKRAHIMIHGHTHRPAIHQLFNNTIGKYQRAVLGCWHNNGSVIEVSTAGVKLLEFSFHA